MGSKMFMSRLGNKKDHNGMPAGHAAFEEWTCEGIRLCLQKISKMSDAVGPGEGDWSRRTLANIWRIPEDGRRGCGHLG